jgi:hypothetical protein
LILYESTAYMAELSNLGVLSRCDTLPVPDQAEDILDLVALAAGLFVAVIMDLGAFAPREAGLGAALGHSRAKSVTIMVLAGSHLIRRACEY